MVWKSKSALRRKLEPLQPVLSVVICFSLTVTSTPVLLAGDLLRGGAAAGQPGSGSVGGAANAANAAAATRMRANSNDALSRTTQALQSVKAMQAAARAAASGRNNLGADPNHPGLQLPNVPDGLLEGGLVPDSGLSAPGTANPVTSWVNAQTPVQTVSGNKVTVTIKQTAQQALLNWSSFNIGSKTKLKFDQSAGGADQSKWIAFNKIVDPTGVPSQILGAIEAPGQVYVLNQNGIIFGGASQVNTHVLAASSLPINTNLFAQGLLNNPDAQFLFSALAMPGGADGTPAFTPEAAFTESGIPGDVIVQKGAQLTSPLSPDGKGGRVMLVGPNVINEGTISTPSGQTILAAGLQVGVAAHASTDPSLRGLDIWVGAVGEGTGTVTNTGLISSLTGSITMVGRQLNQLGALESSTSVDLNGRIDLLASYGAISNPNYDNSGSLGGGAPIFFNQYTGVVTLGEKSVIQILPSADGATAPGLTLPEASRVNIEGRVVHFEKGSMLYAPSGKVDIRAGVWPFSDVDGDGTILNASGEVDSSFLSYYSGGKQRFLFSEGQIYVEPSALISVAGTTDVFVPLAQNILTVELRGSELADSPLQRMGSLAAILLTLDLRKTGDYNGRYWMGTPLGDATGFAALVERTAQQMSAAGGSLSMQAGESIVVRDGAKLDVSGGYYRNEGGLIKTTRLVQGSNIVDIASADPGQIYDGIYNPGFVVSSAKWGVTKQYASPLANQGHYEAEHLSGASGGTLKLVAPGMAIEGELLGTTLQGERERSVTQTLGSLSIAFRAEKIFSAALGEISFLPFSPTPPTVTFLSASNLAPADDFSLVDDEAAPLRGDLRANVVLSTDLLSRGGFGNLAVENVDGDIIVPVGSILQTAARGSISLSGANIHVAGSLIAPGGALSFTTYNISPTAALDFGLLNPSGALYPDTNPDRGLFTLAKGAKLSTAGLVVDERTEKGMQQLLAIQGGSIAVNSYHATLDAGSLVDVSGGARVSTRGAVSYGAAGSIALLAGRDSVLPAAFGSSSFRLAGGSLLLDATLLGYSGAKGGSLALQSSLIEIGSAPTIDGALLLKADFFRQGGFTSYALTGIGAPSSETAAAGEPDPYLPGIYIAPGTHLNPVAVGLMAFPQLGAGQKLDLVRMLLPEGQRQATSISFVATGFDNSFTTDLLEIRGDIVMGEDSSLRLDAGASASFNGQTVTLLGDVSAPGGKITVAGASSFPLASALASSATYARSTVFIGSNASLYAGGATVLTPDAYGRRTGIVYSGGSISVSGNIVAAEGAVLDVSGVSGSLDVPLWMLGQSAEYPATSGINAPLSRLATQRTRIDSNGGYIDLSGSQMLFSDATLLGNSGGKSAAGGALSIFSGRFYPSTSARTSADINLVVTQSGSVIPGSNTQLGVGMAVLNDASVPYGGMGYFAADRFLEGGFDSLDLGAKFLESASPIPYGGNVRFEGPVSIAARGLLRVAGGGVVEATDSVQLVAPYLAIGQAFRQPQNPGDTVLPFQQTLSTTPEYYLAPTHGTGTLSLIGRSIDVGTVSLQKIGAANLIAQSDIRGNGTLNIAGDLTMQAGQIYPSSLATFDIFAYDHAGTAGSVTILAGKATTPPLSAGGKLGIYASNIVQGGVLRAPIGSIVLGWDGSDLDPSDAALTSPTNLVVGGLLSAPVTQSVTLAEGSVTSVSGLLPSGEGMIIPFGLSPDGSSWIAPDGTNVTLSGLPQKEVKIAGANVVTEAGSVIDLRGGGDLAAYRWVSGVGGSIDLLSSPSGDWSASSSYKAGDLVYYKGQTWSARASSTGVTPNVSLYWSRVAESYAILPGLNSELAPYASFNTGVNAGLLKGNPGYVSNLAWGSSIYLNRSSGLAAGSYTLLPKQYAMLPGAYLVTAVSSGITTDYTMPEGANVVSGYLFNQFNKPSESGLFSRFEVASREVIARRAAYAVYSANGFIPAAAEENGLDNVQRLPIDAGHLVFQGINSLELQNSILTDTPTGGRGALADLSSSSAIWITDGSSAPSGVVLDSALLSSWGIESLLIGGVRNIRGTDVTVDVRTSSLTLDNAASPLRGSDVILVSRDQLTMTEGSSLVATGNSILTDRLHIAGDGTLLRVSAGPNAGILRTDLTGSTTPLLTIGAGASLAGASVNLDSSYGTMLDSSVTLNASSLTLGSGQISVVFDSYEDSLAGSVVPSHLVLSGDLLDNVQTVGALKIKSYSSVDFYGSGTFGNAALDLEFISSGIRGFGQGTDNVIVQSRQTTFSNDSKIVAPATPGIASGGFTWLAETIRLGSNTFQIAGYENLTLTASKALIGQGSGGFVALGDLTINTPLITGANGSVQAITATGALNLESTGGESKVEPGLGATLSLTGASINANTNVVLPSGMLHLRATSGDLTVGGNLSAQGTQKVFFDFTRYTNAGQITLQADAGDVHTLAGSTINVAAAANGGDAGTLKVLTPEGHFVVDGTLLAQAGKDGTAGRFILDTESLPSYDTLNSILESGDFLASRKIRVRTGDVLIDGVTRSHEFLLAADSGSITVTGEIDASGKTGGDITLAAHKNLVLGSGAFLNAHAEKFSASGAGGSITLEAGTTYNGVADGSAILDISNTGTVIDLGVDESIAGSYTTPGSSAFNGRFEGILHLRAPRTAGNNDLRISAIGATINGASGILAEGFEVYNLTSTGGVITGWRSSFTALPSASTVQKAVYDSANSFLGTSNYNTMMSRLLGSDSQGLSDRLVLAPGVEIINLTGDLTLGSSSSTSTALGSASQTSADWNLADFRFGPKQAAGVLTLRAAGNLNFYNALSDGFAGTLPTGTVAGQSLWLSPLKTAVGTLPLPLQSWSYRLAAGSDLASADFNQVKPLEEMAEGKGSVIVGKYYAASLVSGSAATTGTAITNRYQVIRTGAGSIDIAAARDVQLRNQFATIYTAGVALPTPTSIFSMDDFVIPSVSQTSAQHPDQGSYLGAAQQIFRPQWSLAGGDVNIRAQHNVGRYTLYNGVEIVDSSRQIPTNWLYRRGYVDPTTGLFGVAGVDGGLGRNVTDSTASTTWWIDFSNFFQGVGALGGGNVTMVAGNDIVNVDAAIPTNARMSGRVANGSGGYDNIAPNANNLVELGGGNLQVRAGHNIDGGIYYVERGQGKLFAGGSITTNASRSPSMGILGSNFFPDSTVQSNTPSVYDPLTWMPTTLFLGKSSFEVNALGSVLIGPASNVFLLPQGVNNKFWYKTYFSTYSSDASVSVASYGSSVTHRLAVTLPGESSPRSMLDAWIMNENLFAGSSQRASYNQPWIRLAEADTVYFQTLFKVNAPTLESTAFGGDVNMVGNLTLFPSPRGSLEIAAAGAINGLNPSGKSMLSSKATTVWTGATINLSDADPLMVPGVTSPLAYFTFSGRTLLSSRDSRTNPFTSLDAMFGETGSYADEAGTPAFQKMRHAPGILHLADLKPVRLYAADGDISGLGLFSPKETRILAGHNIADISFYIQNTKESDISIVAAGRDITAYNENSLIRSVADNFQLGNYIGDLERTTVSGGKTKVFSGDIQISGPGTLQVLAGRNLDLGTGPNLADGTGVGITSIGNFRNPSLPFGGADLILGAGVGFANGLSGGKMDFAGFIDQFILSPAPTSPDYLAQMGYTEEEFLAMSSQEQAVLALEVFYRVLRDSGRALTTGLGIPYMSGAEAIATLFPGDEGWGGGLNTRARDVRTSTGGSIAILAHDGVSMASDIFGNPLTPPGIVTEYGGGISIFTGGDVNIGRARIFTLRGGDIMIWSSNGNIAAGTSPKTVVTAPPTRVVFDINSADVATDLGGLATGGGIGVLAAVTGVVAGDVDLIAPSGYVDAGDAGIRSTGNLSIAASAVLNAGNIQAGGGSTGVPSAPTAPAPNISGMTTASTATTAASSTAQTYAQQKPQTTTTEEEEEASLFNVEVIGYGG